MVIFKSLNQTFQLSRDSGGLVGVSTLVSTLNPDLISTDGV